MVISNGCLVVSCWLLEVRKGQFELAAGLINIGVGWFTRKSIRNS